MLNIMRTVANLSTPFLSSPLSSLRFISLFSDFTPKQSIPNPFFFLSSSSFHSSNQFTLKLSDLDNAFDSILNINEAVALFHYMLQMKPKPSSWDYTKLFTSIVKIEHHSEAVKLEHYSQVILMFKELILLGYPVNEYMVATVINCYGHLKQVDLSFGVVAASIKRGYFPDIVTFTCMIKAYFLQGKVVEAVDLFKKLIRDDLCEVDEYTMATVLNGLSKSGNIVSAVELLQLSEKKEWKVNVAGYTAVIDGLCKSGMLKQGKDLLFRMVDKDILPDVVTYTSFIHGLCMNQKLALGCYTYNELSSKGINPDVITYTVMIQGFCREGLFRDAKELLEKMEQEGCFPDSVTYNIIIQGCFQLHHRGNFYSIDLLKHIVGRDFQLLASTFFLLLRQMELLRQMPGIYDDDVIRHLMRKLISHGALHQMRDDNDEYMVSSFIHRLNSSDSRSGIS